MTGFLDGQVHESGGYVIERSLRFSAASSNYLTRTPSVASDRRTLTFSAWVKRGQLSKTQDILIAGSNVAGQLSTQISFLSNDKLWVYSTIAGGATAIQLETTQLFRDVGAWYHIVVQFDTTNATASDRVKLYVNGVRVTSFSTATYPAQNYDTAYNNTVVHTLGRFSVVSANHFDGHFAETILAESALTPSSFGETNIETGEWVAKPYTGTYGTNGFYLDFADGTSTTTLGYDAAGSNDWTLTNFTRSAGVNDCWMKDVPAGNGEASAVQPSGNYAVLNPLNLGSTVTLSKGNLTMTEGGTYATTVSSIAMTSGKWYAEMTVSANSFGGTVGIAKLGYSPTSRLGFQANTWSYNNDGAMYYNSVQLGVTQSSYTTNDVIGIAFDADSLTIEFYKNNVLQGVTYTSGNSGLSAGEFYFATGHINSTSNWNFGQRSFAYTPPTGFKALCTSNLANVAIKKGSSQFVAKTRTGTGASYSVTDIPFLVGWLFGKSRSAATDWFSYDVNRGVQKQLEFNTTSAETTETTGLTAFNSDGYSGGALAQMNTNAATYIDYMFKAGGAPVSNTDGSITSQVSANVTAGFSIVTYTGTGANATVGHGLGKAPKMVIVKSRGGVTNWMVWHTAFVGTDYILLNRTNAKNTIAGVWNSTTPTSTVFSVGTNADVNPVATMVAYCFAEIEGFSKAFSFTGNANADGTFVYLGFKPRWILLKCSSTTGNWYIFDTVRNTFNVVGEQLYPNLANAGSTVTTLDVVSNGFKLRLAGDPNAAQTYVGFAIAETPINYANAF